VGVDAAKVALELLQGAQLAEGELGISIDEALDPAYWRGLNPSLSVGGTRDATAFEGAELSSEEERRLLARIMSEGWFHTSATLADGRLGDLRGGVYTLRERGLPPSFCFVYDEYWLVARAPSLTRLVSSALGPGYRQISNVWCHYVNPTKRASGWQPHRDGFQNAEQRLTVWIPLTEATLDNGCMYLVPKGTVPPGTSLAEANVNALLQNTRALPAKPGEALGWTFEVVHWGGSVSEDATHARIALSFEFLGADAEPDDSERPVYPVAEPLPSFEERLYCICRGLVQYGQFEPSLLRYAELAKGVGARVERIALGRSA
jgi:hypothetical protein